MQIKVKLTDGNTYVLGFKHYYEVTPVVHSNSQGNSPRYWTDFRVDVIKRPSVTVAYLRNSETGEILKESVTIRNPTDNPDKRIARSIAINRLVADMDARDSSAVINAYNKRHSISEKSSKEVINA